ncbi:MAG: plasmid stabilization protein [Devosia nanyangense]|uniref:Plasmid stabilization protein n=1 Tax=Devosia nanyangense TaxID=1228055 RepID=A0A933L4B9_9HYPH|nr:plasmid stabilization protein [Devosia nanyangense]
MAALTIRNIDEQLKRDLRRRAAANDRSMEEEARVILRRALNGAQPASEGLATSIRREVERLGGGIDFELPDDEPYEPMTFDAE